MGREAVPVNSEPPRFGDRSGSFKDTGCNVLGPRGSQPPTRHVGGERGPHASLV